MSEEVNALVITGHAHMLTQEAPDHGRGDVIDNLWEVRSGSLNWHNGQPITEQDITNLYAGEVFLDLGGLATCMYSLVLPANPRPSNHWRELALNVIDAISPFDSGESLPADLSIKTWWPDLRLSERGSPNMFEGSLAAQPSIEYELKEKWAKAQAVHAERGSVTIRAYNTKELLRGLGVVKRDDIAPDDVDFDETANIVRQTHNLGGLADHSGVSASMLELPYYQTFSFIDKNLVEMLANGLMDLRSVAEAIA
jgi:hypothetical protein